MGNILCCCVCPKVSSESDQDEGSGCPPESKICEAAAEDTTAAAPMAAAIAPAKLTVEAGEGLPVCDICDGEMPEDRALESDPSDDPEAEKSPADAQEIEENSCRNHHKMVLEEYRMSDPTWKTIFRFIHSLFYAKRVYINRLIKSANINICPNTWRRIILGAFLAAIDVENNVAELSKELCKLFERMSADHM
ncbi:hypothetical protein P7K49_023675 [Saguinus oedipus]|uniref:Uncharacterized protein n=1 Tax=Saguinus oedipus TaxID=9490 RepID=A0ABQ9UMG0_SAGOE|nr:hypothetical protein P7K49_023675 [Saguinus oedipus]